MSVEDISAAREALGKREGIPKSSWDRNIGFWTEDSSSDGVGVAAVASWAREKRLDGVVWTALSHGFRKDRKPVPTEEEVVDHLRGLKDKARRRAEEYVRRAPSQVDTVVRRRVESEMGWTPIEGGSGT